MKLRLLVFLLLGSLSVAAEEPRPVSLVQLVSTPERFQGKLVSVVGFLDLDPHNEADSLYLHSEDKKHGLILNRVIVQRSPLTYDRRESLNHNYVLVVGRFKAAGPREVPIGHIVDVTKCVVWSTLADPRGAK